MSLIKVNRAMNAPHVQALADVYERMIYYSAAARVSRKKEDSDDNYTRVVKRIDEIEIIINKLKNVVLYYNDMSIISGSDKDIIEVERENVKDHIDEIGYLLDTFAALLKKLLNVDLDDRADIDTKFGREINVLGHSIDLLAELFQVKVSESSPNTLWEPIYINYLFELREGKRKGK